MPSILRVCRRTPYSVHRIQYAFPAPPNAAWPFGTGSRDARMRAAKPPFGAYSGEAAMEEMEPPLEQLHETVHHEAHHSQENWITPRSR